MQFSKLPPDAGEVRNIITKASKYTLLSGKIYRMGKVAHMLRCLEESNLVLVLTRVHKGACSSHIGGKDLSHKLLRASYY